MLLLTEGRTGSLGGKINFPKNNILMENRYKIYFLSYFKRYEHFILIYLKRTYKQIRTNI
jgi:hypothetical protein